VTQTPLPEWVATDLDLRGNQLLNARVHNALGPPANPAKGQFWFDTTTDILKWYDGTKWTSSNTSYGTISDDGANRPPRARLNFRSTASLNATVTDESGSGTSSVSVDAKYGPVVSTVTPNMAPGDGTAPTLARSDHSHGTPPTSGQDTTMVTWWQYGTEQWSQLSPPTTFVPELAEGTVGGGWQLSAGGSIAYTGDPIPVAPTGVYRNSVRVAAVGDDAGLSLGWLCYDADLNLLGQVRCANGVPVRAAAEASGLTARNMVTDPSGDGHTLGASATTNITVDFQDGVLGETVAYHTGPNDLGGGLTSIDNRQGRYVAGKDSSIGLGNHPPYGRGASWQRLGLYDATSVEGWEIPTTDSTTTVDFQFHTIPDPGTTSLIDASSILDLQYHSADMDDQQDLSIGIMFGFLGDGIPQEVRFYIEGSGDGMTYFEVHTNDVDPARWYVAKHTIVGRDATLSIIDDLGATVLSYTHTLPEGWVQVLWLEAYASMLYDTPVGPSQWLEVYVDNLKVSWAAAGGSNGWHSETLSGTAAPAAISYATDQFYSGPHSIKAGWPDLDETTSQSNCVIETEAFPPNTPVVLGARVRVPAGSPDVRLDVLGRGTGPVITAKDQWVYSEVRATTSSDPTLVGMSTTSPSSGTSAYIDDVICREDTGPLPGGRTFFDGDTLDTADTAFVWDGEPENSTSSYYTLEPAWETMSGYIAIGDGPEPGVGMIAGVEEAVNPLPGTVYFRPFVAATAGVLAVDTHEVARGQRDQIVLDGLSTGWVEVEGTVSAAKMVTLDLAPPNVDPVVPLRIGPVQDPPAQPGDVTSRSYVDRGLGLLPGETTTPPQFLWEGLAGAEPTPADLGFDFAAWPLFAAWLDTAVPQARITVLTGGYSGVNYNPCTTLLTPPTYNPPPNCYRVVSMAPANGVMIGISTGSAVANTSDYLLMRCAAYSGVNDDGLSGTYAGFAGDVVASSSGASISRVPYTTFSVTTVTAGTRYMFRTEYSHGGASAMTYRDRVIVVYLPGAARMGAA
jgi:hypothetical protein